MVCSTLPAMKPQYAPAFPAVFNALGLMSGTSLDGVDLCLIKTDGEGFVEVAGRHARPYSAELKARLQQAAQGDIPLSDLLRLERDVTEQYALALLDSGLLAEADVVGCHGQTIRHLPTEGLTWQLGDPNWLAERLASAGHMLPVVMDFRRRDMAAGGEGAPLAPLFHAVMLNRGGTGEPAGKAVLNIGGVANVTLVGADGTVLASDCGPGMGLLDMWVQAKAGAAFDRDGALAAAGRVDEGVVAWALQEIRFWQRPVPRSADRYEFGAVLERLAGASVPDGAATLAALTVAGVDATLRALGTAPESLLALYVVGGGAFNPVVMDGFKAHGWKALGGDALGWEPLDVEAACFAWLAVRRLRGLVTSNPATTRCRRATVGGVVTGNW